MSDKLKTAALAGAGILVFVIGLNVSLRFGAEQFTAVSIGLLPALLLLFPVVRSQFEGQLKFWQWVAILSLSLVFATLLHNIFGGLT